MRIAILTGGTRGDVQPYVALGVGLQRAGYQVCVTATERFRGLVTKAGLEFTPSGALDPQAFLHLPGDYGKTTGAGAACHTRHDEYGIGLEKLLRLPDFFHDIVGVFQGNLRAQCVIAADSLPP